jgi:hypothetical protein
VNDDVVVAAEIVRLQHLAEDRAERRQKESVGLEDAAVQAAAHVHVRVQPETKVVLYIKLIIHK